MHIKKILFISLVLASCGTKKESYGLEPVNVNGFDGTTVGTQTGISSGGAGGDENTLSLLNTSTNKAVSISVDPFEVKFTQTMPFEVSNIERSMHGYSIFFGKEDFAVVDTEGNLQRNPVSLVGQLASYGVDLLNGWLVLMDDIGSIGYVKIEKSGKVVGTYASGSVVNGLSIKRGTLLSNGTLVVTTAADSITSIDIEQTIGQQDVVSKQVSLPPLDSETEVEVAEAKEPEMGVPGVSVEEEEDPVSENIDWIASVPGNDHLGFLRRGNYLQTVNLNEGSILATEEVTAPKGFPFFKPTPHFIGKKDNNRLSLYYPNSDGSISSNELVMPLSSFSGESLQSYLDLKAGTITILLKAAESGVVRLRLKDSLVLTSHSLPKSLYYGLTPEYVVMLKDSSLGQAERWSLKKDPEPAVLEGFFFEPVSSSR